MSGVILMSAKQRHKKTTDRELLFYRNKYKKNKTKFTENKRELSKKLEVQIKAYVNSGGQIQKCTPCTYSDSQRLAMTENQKSRACGAIK